MKALLRIKTLVRINILKTIPTANLKDNVEYLCSFYSKSKELKKKNYTVARVGKCMGGNILKQFPFGFQVCFNFCLNMSMSALVKSSNILNLSTDVI